MNFHCSLVFVWLNLRWGNKSMIIKTSGSRADERDGSKETVTPCKTAVFTSQVDLRILQEVLKTPASMSRQTVCLPKMDTDTQTIHKYTHHCGDSPLISTSIILIQSNIANPYPGLRLTINNQTKYKTFVYFSFWLHLQNFMKLRSPEKKSPQAKQ